MKVIKRDGREAPFDNTRIRKAIEAANAEVAEADRLSEAMVVFIVDRIEHLCETLGRAVSVEEIQDTIEDELLAADRPRLMRHYADYRFKRELIRKANTTDGRILALIERNNEEIQEKQSVIRKNNVKIKELDSIHSSSEGAK